MCDQNCVVQSADKQTDRNTDRQTHAWTDKKGKTEGPKLLSNDIFYFRTVIQQKSKRYSIQAQLRAEADRLWCLRSTDV